MKKLKQSIPKAKQGLNQNLPPISYIVRKENQLHSIFVPRTFKFGEAGMSIGSDIIISFLSFDAQLFTKFLLLSPNWHTCLLQALDDHCNQFEN